MKKNGLLVYLICAALVAAQSAFAETDPDLHRDLTALEQEYHSALHRAEQTKLFDTVDFLYKEHKDGIPVRLHEKNRTLVLPLFLSLNTTKRAVGIALSSNNLLGKKENVSLDLGVSKDGAQIEGFLSVHKHSFGAGYTHLSFNQSFYANGWSSTPGVFVSSENSQDYRATWLGSLHTRQDLVFVSYQYTVSDHWRVGVTPHYSYYNYQGHALDSGKHNYMDFTVQYADKTNLSMDMGKLDDEKHAHKNAMLKNLPRTVAGKLAQVTYSTGGKWLDSDYHIDKISLSGAYMWTFKDHNKLAFFAKGERAFSVPFSSEVESNDLLFGLGIYDREQRGKGGVSAGVSFTCFLLKNQVGLLSLMPFLEQAYVTAGGHSYSPHSGAGAVLEYRLWAIPFPLGINFTQNLNDGSHHIGVRIGGHF